MINNFYGGNKLASFNYCLKIKFLFLLVLITATSETAAQENMVDRMNRMVRTEYEFASMAAESGTRDAFLSFIADEGILFRPTPVNGKKFLLTQKKSEGLLSWYPSYAFISKSGDIGCTTGPADFRRDRDSEPVWYGNFATVWRLQEDGKWRFLIDAGISNGKPEIVEKKLEPGKIDNNGFEKPRTIKTGKDLIFSIDKEFNLNIHNKELMKIYLEYIDDDTRLLREGISPVIGVKNILDYLKYTNEKFRFEQNDGNISSAGDFGFVYGLAQNVEQTGDKIKKYNYLRIWRNISGEWKIIIEVFSLLPQ